MRSLTILALAFATATLNAQSTVRTPVVATAPRPVFTSVSAGSAHFCGLDSDGDAQCWGDGQWGQLGDGLAISSATAVRVAHPRSGRFRQVVAGSTHSCALTEEGRAFCWGSDASGILGEARLEESCEGSPCATSPVPVAPSLRFDSLSAGFEHMCGLVRGRAYCWGRADAGQLGPALAADSCDDVACSRTPLLVSESIRFSAISARGTHTCGIAAKRVLCWGDDARGQLGGVDRSAAPPSLSPPIGDTLASRVSAAGWYSCAITAHGTVVCWGTNVHGALGTPSGQAHAAVVKSPDGRKFVEVSAGGTHTCALTDAGAAYCWGTATDGRLGNWAGWRCGFTECSPEPVRVALRERLTHVAAGGVASCATTRAGAIYCWGGITSATKRIAADHR